MARAVLHIGTHKTATSWVQATMAGNRELLARHGIVYPDYAPEDGHHGLIAEWVKLPVKYHLAQGNLAEWDRLAQAHAGTDVTLLLSSEEFSRANARVHFDEINAKLAAFEEVKVVCLLRDQISYIQSIYLQTTKNVVVKGWINFLDDALASETATGLFLNYETLYDFLARFYRPDQIVLADYDTVRRRPGGVVQFLLDQCGSDLGAEALEASIRGANVSPPPLAGWAANVVARPGVAQSWLVETVADVMGSLYDPNKRTTLYSREEYRRAKAKFDPLNAQFHDRMAALGSDLSIKMPDWDTDETIFREDIRADLWIRLSAALYRRGLKT